MQILKKTNLDALKKAKKLGSEGVLKLLRKKGLKGRGGAGFPTADKWDFAGKSKSEKKFIVCNADEGEPGTFKDRLILEKNPETVVEGILIAAYTIGAEKAFIYLRGEYECLRTLLQKAVASVIKKSGSKTSVEIFLGAGAYVCGDETAILSSLEGKRGQPRVKPPFPTDKGFEGMPTVINNVETLASVAQAIAFDDWNPDLTLHCISGDVELPGVYEFGSDIKLAEIVYLAHPKNTPKAVYFGCFGGCLPYKGNEMMPLNPENVCREDCLLGACSMIVVDETRSMADIAVNLAKFYEFESCGKCTPCREGTMRVLHILQNIAVGNAKKEDIDTLQELAEVIRDTSSCGLGQTSTHHILNALKYFRKDFEERLKK